MGGPWVHVDSCKRKNSKRELLGLPGPAQYWAGPVESEVESMCHDVVPGGGSLRNQFAVFLHVD